MRIRLRVIRLVLGLLSCVGILLLSGCLSWFNTDPVAQFTATPGQGAAPLDVWFDASASSDPDGDSLSYSWNFDDGGSAVGVTCVHRFESPGTYRVELTVDDGWGGAAGAYVTIEVGAAARTCYAVVVGIADYYQNPLSWTDDDAWAFTNQLLTSSMWDPNNIVLLLNAEATTTNFVAALSAISAAATPNDLLVVFFSGHGSQWADTIPMDEPDGMDEALCFFDRDMTDDWLALELNQVPVGEILVLVDACHAGGIIRGQTDTDGSARSVGVGLIEDLVKEQTAGTKDLADLSRSIVAIAASADYQYSIEWPSLQHGVFTYYLLEAMTGLADLYGNMDGLISAEECFAYLAPNVVNFTTMVGSVHHPQLLDYVPGALNFMD